MRCFILEARVNASPWPSVAEIRHACGRRRLASVSASALLFAVPVTRMSRSQLSSAQTLYRAAR